MSEELNYPESASSTTDIESSTDDQVTIKECCKQRLKPLCQVRRVRSKGAILVVIWTFLVTTVFFIALQTASQLSSKWFNSIMYVALVATLPLAGSLADVRFGRYKLISVSLWIMWISSLLLTGTLVVGEFRHFQHQAILSIVLAVLMGIGWGGFQANIIQFGIDQLTDASVTEYKSFAVWFTCAYTASELVLYYMLQCVQYKLLLPLIVCCCLTLALTLKILFNNVLVKEPSTQNPFKLVYKVISYAIKHKYPRQRSAFTYCEDDIPSRIDLGKSKYGGPFTIEQVEDVKTSFQIILVLLIGCALYCVSDESYFVQTKVRNMFNYHPSPQSLDKCSSEFIINGFYFICGTVLIPFHELLLYPLFGRLLHNVTSFKKFAIGALLRISRLLVLLIIVTYSRHHYYQISSNATLPCLFQEPPGFLGAYTDNRWTVIPEFMFATSDLLIYIGTLEFICAQVPYSMKGLMVGFVFFFLGLFKPAFNAIHQIFETKSLSWGTGVISCGFWYFVTKISLQATAIIIFVIVMKYYKKRKREDVLPNDHMFAERYYSS